MLCQSSGLGVSALNPPVINGTTLHFHFCCPVVPSGPGASQFSHAPSWCCCPLGSSCLSVWNLKSHRILAMLFSTTFGSVAHWGQIHMWHQWGGCGSPDAFIGVWICVYMLDRKHLDVGKKCLYVRVWVNDICCITWFECSSRVKNCYLRTSPFTMFLYTILATWVFLSVFRLWNSLILKSKWNNSTELRNNFVAVRPTEPVSLVSAKIETQYAIFAFCILLILN